MEVAELKMLLNSGIGVFVAMFVVAPAMPNWRQNIPLLATIYATFFAANLYLASITSPGIPAVFRAAFIASLPILSGYVWSIVKTKYKGPTKF
ncbi:MAG: hypothetical protein JNN20_13580 [Betaproteobacteria bacterium]|nr:hypothetical protein [Betaproteobacteria bacterium]